MAHRQDIQFLVLIKALGVIAYAVTDSATPCTWLIFDPHYPTQKTPLKLRNMFGRDVILHEPWTFSLSAC